MQYDNLMRELVGKENAAPLLEVLFGLQMQQVQPLKTRLAKTQLEVDALFKVQMVDGQWQLVHLEVQTGNERAMPMRMLRYLCHIEATAGQDADLASPLPLQFVLYMGAGPLTMPAAPPYLQLACYSYTQVNIADFPADLFLQLPDPDLQLLALLGKTANPKTLLEHLFRLIYDSGEPVTKQRKRAQRLYILSNLRKLDDECLTLVQNMDPALIDILKESSLYKQVMAEGIEKGREEGREEGLLQAAAAVVLDGRFSIAEAAVFFELNRTALADAVARQQAKGR